MIDNFFDESNNTKNWEDMASSPRIPNNEKYWINKGKVGKKVMLYFHDDLDGIFSSVAIKKYLLDKNFEIVGYGVVNYQEGWDVVELDDKYINVAVDFAELTDGIDVYIDHHGEFGIDDELGGKNAIKTDTFSAYEGIMDQLGLPVDSMILDIISMVDAARYDDYNVKWTDLMNWDYEYFKNHDNPKLMFAGVFNQLLKRGDYRTFIEVVHNATEPSIYQIFRLFKILYPMNNLNWMALKEMRKYEPQSNEHTIWESLSNDDSETNKVLSSKTYTLFADFLEDGLWRLDQVKSRTSGSEEFKTVITSQKDFVEKFKETKSYPESSRSKYAGMSADILKMDGYVVIGELAYIPTGTWANAIRARSIIERDIETGRLQGVTSKKDVKWVLLQYGDTLQVASFDDIENYNTVDLPKNKDGVVIDDLKFYVRDLLKRFKDTLDFNNDDTISGGHKGIGTISNIGVYRYNHKGNDKKLSKLNNMRYLDLFKNYMIANLSGIPWKLSLSWENPFSNDRAEEPTPLQARIMSLNQIRIVDLNTMKLSYPKLYEHKPNLGDLKRKAAAEKEMEKEKERERLIKAKIEAEMKHKFYQEKRDGKSYEEWKEENSV